MELFLQERRHRQRRHALPVRGVLLNGKDNLGAKPQAEVVAEILAAIKKRKA